MFRALSLTCLALLMIAAGGSTAMAKDTIAVLGLEVIDANGTPTVQDTQIAKDLTEGLRGRAKAGTGPYQLAAGSDKELADLKLLNSCDETPACMSAIGNQMGAAVLMYGRLEKQKGAYQITMKLLDVRSKKVEKSSSDVIPASQATNPAELQAWAKKIYGKLTGETSTGIIAVRLHNADHGTILINGEEKGNITNGAGQVAGLSEGKYKLAVESEGFHRWEQDVTVTAGQTTSVPVDLEKSGGGGDVVIGTGSGDGSAGAGSGAGHGGGGGNSGMIWKVMAIGGIAGAAVSGGVWTYAYFSDISPYDGKAVTVNGTDGKPLLINGHPPGSDECKMSDVRRASGPDNAKFDKACSGYSLTRVTVPLTIGFSAIAIAGVIGYMVTHKNGDEHQTTAGRHTHKPTFAVIPVMSPDGGGATFRMEW